MADTPEGTRLTAEFGCGDAPHVDDNDDTYCGDEQIINQKVVMITD
jgi:hypothetical protein